ncbi:hypothetical protein M9H77_09994 [Catharanthus roseus]|uniref:Uncharacterized protein n=1 Tax=Catharanthus roseus TaxID=4058 RepID=A0ACC0C2C6_CATRO|nr:hypothetical protein M9H77_09994 [Catharanthus roseus]
MAMVTLNATSNADIPKALAYKTSSNLREASFSSYLNGAEETFILQLAESNQSLIKTPQISTYLVSKKKVEENEIDVFNAEKYFNEEVGDESPRIVNNSSPILVQKKEEDHHLPVELYPVNLQTRPGTPSIRSESSLNSRTALLHNIPGNHQPRKTNKAKTRKGFLSALGCHCSCGDKNSVDIDDHIGKNSSKKIGKISKSPKDVSQESPWMREDLQNRKQKDFRFPSSNPKIRTEVVVLEDDTRRNSLEVFGSPIGNRKGKKSISLDRSINMLAWDAIVPPKVEGIEVSAKSGHDSDSDASSDLFEIESFSTNPTQANNYAPSEVSIDWSVVTASAADFSALSDTEEVLDLALNGKRTTIKDNPRRRPSILSGCTSHKAVNVAGDIRKINEKSSPGRHQKTDFLMPMTRFHAENDVSRFDKRNGRFSYDTGLLPCSQPSWAAQVLHNH